MLNTHQTAHFKRINFMVYKVHLNVTTIFFKEKEIISIEYTYTELYFQIYRVLGEVEEPCLG